MSFSPVSVGQGCMWPSFWRPHAPHLSLIIASWWIAPLASTLIPAVMGRRHSSYQRPFWLGIQPRAFLRPKERDVSAGDPHLSLRFLSRPTLISILCCLMKKRRKENCGCSRSAGLLRASAIGRRSVWLCSPLVPGTRTDVWRRASPAGAQPLTHVGGKLNEQFEYIFFWRFETIAKSYNRYKYSSRNQGRPPG